MALDYGRRRIGVSVSDPTGTIASPRGFIDRGPPPRRSGKSVAMPPGLPDDLLELVLEVRPSRILVGIPLMMDGSAGEMAQEARAFAGALAEATGVEVIEWDERLTTARAEREIQSLGLRKSRREKKGRSDEMAATLMLTDYLRSVST
ncbi:MAG: Holliday junction resolvase RuvX [Gemmatimonadota bacterium]